MKSHFIKYAVLLGVVLAISGFTAHAQSGDQENRQVKVINRASAPIYHLYISNVDEDNWGPDQLDWNESIGTNQYILINMDDGTGHCLYDIKAVLSDGREAVERHVNVCTIGTWTVYN